jgi:type IV pilus assembly protein PilC
MISVGESTGSLDKMLFKVSNFYDLELESEIKGLTSIIEPILIVGLGIVIGGIAVSVMLPMFDLTKVMGR